MRNAAMIAAWACLAYVAFVTLSPIEMRMSINSDVGSFVEHFGAFLAIALLMGLAYPRQAMLVVILSIGCVLILEVLQLAVPGRHARVSDAVVKSAGVVAGWVLSRWINARWKPCRAP
jgi:VanZ family protein